jgi:sec-independent protein translocase protein TatA
MIGLSSPTHIVLLLLIALLLFGAKRLPEIGRSLGHGMREFKDSVSGSDDHETHISQAERLPELGHSLGQGVREFKDSVTDSGEHRHIAEAAAPPADEAEPTLMAPHKRETV